MGMSQITSGMYSLNNRTSLEKMSHIGISKTHSFSSLVTDSAAAGTAIACGEKTINGTLGINPQNKELKSILEISKDYGYKTGIIATSSIVHATPAAFYANVVSRNQYEDIALQLSQNEVDFFVGGGRDYFTKRDDKNFMKHTLAWQKGKEVEIKYRDVHSRTLTNDVQYFPPKERVY